MVVVGKIEAESNLGRAFFRAIRVEIVCRSTNQNNESACVLQPCGKPENTEEHPQTKVNDVVFPDYHLGLWDQSISFNFVQSDNTNEATGPNKDSNNTENEVQSWDENDSLGAGQEVS